MLRNVEHRDFMHIACTSRTNSLGIKQGYLFLGHEYLFMGSWSTDI